MLQPITPCERVVERIAIFATVVIVLIIILVTGCPKKADDKHAKVSKDLSAAISKCVHMCSILKNAGVNIGKGTCIIPKYGKYSCAAIVNEHGHCYPYISGKTKEIILDASCKYVTVR